MQTPLNLAKSTESQRTTSLNQILSEKEAAENGVWLFVYGLLAKQPPFTFTHHKVFTLPNWQRSFNLADPMNRGTPKSPGLTLGLHAGGQCTGIAYFIPQPEVIPGLTKVWEQEMLLPFYTPQWLFHGENGEEYELLTMLTNLASPALKPNLSIEETASIIKNAHGEAGTNRAYLQDVITAFAEHDVEDTYLTRIAAAL